MTREREGRVPSLLLRQIDVLCDEFEEAWRTQRNPRIEDYLSRISPEARSAALVELIAAEVELRRAAGEPVDPQQYRERFRHIVSAASDSQLKDPNLPAPSPADTLTPAPSEGEDWKTRYASADEIDAAFELLRRSTKTTPSPADVESFGSHSLSETADSKQARAETEDPIPETIGRYRIQKRLGTGGFGTVYLAHDPDLDRLVALKVPRPGRFSSEEQMASFLQEARTAVQLEHPGIVAVHDVFREAGRVAVVQKYISGRDLAAELEAGAIPPERCVELAIAVAEALSFAHRKGFVHRDLKPSNILLDEEGRPHIADFGLAVHENFQRRLRDEVSGTPSYMSPEQVRGETHRLDGRSDIWSLGVIFYEMLLGRRPFAGEQLDELFDEIKHRDPRPPRQVNPQLPAELERICLKCLSKRATDRYSTAADLADDLRHWLAGDQEPKTTTPVVVEKPKVVPKGLRSFGEEDADFFLDLLPGPRGRDGLPESIRFWKTRIEETDADKTFSVGLLYGPSGCGKSSLVKAGLLPRLASHVVSIYVEATPADTEVRLLKGLRKACPGIPSESSLPELFESLRHGLWMPRGKKLVVVLDQFEQWLHAHRGGQETQLVQALRQCDGGRVQCVVMVRDDFWMAVTRFLDNLEVELLKGQNAATVDLFDPRHARRVLAAFGRAYGVLPEKPSEASAEQNQFLEQAVSDLSEDGKVVCVHLAMFAEMVKGKTWVPTTLRKVGGTTGIGVEFLEETFSSHTALPKHRLHQKAARAVLKALLPESGTDIKGSMQPSEELLEASGYADRPREFADLVHILDSEIRLITPTDPEGMTSDSNSPDPALTGCIVPVGAGRGCQYYQLTHDYLVPSLREWLTRKQKETRKGRAELRLAERAALWNAKPERQQLPSLWEYFTVVTYVPRKHRTEPQRKMMRAATRHYIAVGTAALALLLVVAFALQQFLATQERKSVRRATDALQSTIGSGVPFAIRDLERLSKAMVVQELNDRFADPGVDRKLPLAYALARFGRTESRFLVEAVSNARAEECDNLVTALGYARGSALQTLKDAAANATAKKDWILKTRLATVALHLGDTTVAAEMLGSIAPDPIQRTMFIEHFAKWSGDWARLADVLRDADDPSLRSGMSLAMGSIEDASEAAKQKWQEALAAWHRDEPDSGTHSASGWALRAWGLPLPKIPEAGQSREGFGWQQTKLGLTLVRIPAGEVDAPDEQGSTKRNRITRDFWLSDREVTQGLFGQFLKDKDAEKPEKPEEISGSQTGEPSRPVVSVSWYDAVMFCNWLSRQEGRNVCYQKDGKEKIRVYDNTTKEYDAWKLIPGANGYRLPTEDEWEYACRATTTTAFCFGDAEELLDRYAVFVKNAKSGPDAVGRKLCNAWGVFDMHGNVWEWCQEWYEVGSFRVSRGGGWGFGAAGCRSASRHGFVPTYRGSYDGFRLALSSSGVSPEAAQEK